MTDRQVLKRARTLAEMAPSRSVTVDLLADREGETPRLLEPPVLYLEDTEAPAYALTNAKRGIGVGTKRQTTTPTGDRETVVLVTGRRTLCLVGGDDEDRVTEVPHDVVAEVSYHTGLFGHRLEIRTPRKRYHCWVSRTTDEGVLARAAEYVRERKPAAPYETPDWDDERDAASEGAAEPEPQFSYRGRPVTREQHPGLPDEPPGGEDGPSDEKGGPSNEEGGPRDEEEVHSDEGDDRESTATTTSGADGDVESATDERATDSDARSGDSRRGNGVTPRKG